MQSRRLADGSGGGRSYEPACVRAIDSYLTLSQQADRVSVELDNVTIPGVVSHVVEPEDSLVIALQECVATREGQSPPPPKDDTVKKP
jgi:hypothetical protein